MRTFLRVLSFTSVALHAILFFALALFCSLSPMYGGDSKFVTVTNNTGLAAADLHLTFTGTGGSLRVDSVAVVALSCFYPNVPTNGTPSDSAVIVWPAACVSAGSAVTLIAETDNGPLAFASGYWTDGGGNNIGNINPGDITLLPLPPPGAGPPFCALKILAETKPLNANYTPWVFGGNPARPTCWARWCCIPTQQIQYRLIVCKFNKRIDRLMELRMWIPPNPGLIGCAPLTGWLPDGIFPGFWGWQFTTIPPPPDTGNIKGPPPNRPDSAVTPPTQFEVRNSDDSGKTFRQADDFTSVFLYIHEYLQIYSDPSLRPISGFDTTLQRMAFGFLYANIFLNQFKSEIDSVNRHEPASVLDSMKAHINKMSGASNSIFSMFLNGMVSSSQPFKLLSQSLRGLATDMKGFGHLRLLNAGNNLVSMADGIDVSANMADSGVATQNQKDLFLWGIRNRFIPMVRHFALAMAPHVRVKLDLSPYQWFPSTISGAKVNVYNRTNGNLLYSDVIPISDRYEVDIPILGPDTTWRVDIKLPSFLSKRINIDASDGMTIGPFSKMTAEGTSADALTLTLGDVDGNDCINQADLDKVRADSGMGGRFATVVPSSDINGDGIV
ncbi:MAG: hypothetical protein HY277_03615, partial [Ignavibacteriales bacterium]|nr:hypothetical protein [Ignavibacteriales bacterium]